jgi:hypothetical protein
MFAQVLVMNTHLLHSHHHRQLEFRHHRQHQSSKKVR